MKLSLNTKSVNTNLSKRSEFKYPYDML